MMFKKGSEVIVHQYKELPIVGIVYAHRTDIDEHCFEIYFQEINGDVVKSLFELNQLEPIDHVYKKVYENELASIKQKIELLTSKNERQDLFEMLIQNVGLEKAIDSFKNMNWEIPTRP